MPKIMLDSEKLILLMKTRPAIYDYACSEYNNKEYTEILWDEIAVGMESTTAACKLKWLALKNSYSREIRNRREAITKPNTSKKKRKSWYLASQMSFLRNSLKYEEKYNEEIVRNEQLTADSNVIYDESCSSSQLQEAEHKYYVSTENINIKLNSPSSQCDPAFETLQQTSPAALPLHAKPIVESSRQNSNPKRIRLEDSGAKEQNISFFNSILPDLLKLSERRQRLFKQEVILDLNKSLDEQEMES